MKVILIGSRQQFDKATGAGVNRYSYELYNNLKHMIKTTKTIEIGKDNIIFKKFPFLNTLYFNFEYKFLNFNMFDIIHNLSANNPISKSKNPITISTVHDLIPLDKEVMLSSYRNQKNLLYKHLLKWTSFLNYLTSSNALKKSVKNSDYLIVNSTQTRDEVINLGFDKNKVFVVNLGLDMRFTKSLKQKLGNKKEFIIGYIGSSGSRKNIKMIYDAAQKIKYQNIQFNIYTTLIIESNYLKSKPVNVSLMGFAPEEKIVEIYDSFDVFVFPSLYEGFGLPILEAQARGLPVIIYKYGKIPKEVRRYCFEAESPEHMAQIIEELKENGYNEKKRREAMDYARSFTWERTAKETLEVYKKVLER